MVARNRGQALVEFALVAPILLLLLVASVDLGRGMVMYGLLQGASRDAARMAVLQYFNDSNTAAASCTSLTPACPLQTPVQRAHALDSLGVGVVYQDSGDISSPPSYGTYIANPDPTQPGTITLAPGTLDNTVYVFIYELDSTAGNPSPRWSCPTAPCVASFGAAVRTTGHQRVVVDLELRWRPIMATFLGIPSTITFKSIATERIEF